MITTVPSPVPGDVSTQEVAADIAADIQQEHETLLPGGEKPTITPAQEVHPRGGKEVI